MRTCAYYEYIIHIFMISHGRQLYLMRFILYASIYENTIRTDYCVHRNINRIVYNYSWLHTNQFHSSSYTPSTHALINIVFSYNLCVHVCVMNISYISSWHHKNMGKIRLMPSQIEFGFAAVWLKASRIGNGATEVWLMPSQIGNGATEVRARGSHVQNSFAEVLAEASRGHDRATG